MRSDMMNLRTAFRKPKKWWRMGVIHRKGQKAAMTKVCDESGEIKEREKAVGLWKRHFERVLNGDEVGEDSEELREALTVNPGNMVEATIVREEVVWALNGLRQRSAPGRDGVTVEMMCCEVLVDFWWTLFAWCWRKGITSSEWRRSVIVPIPKKKSNCVVGRKTSGVYP